MTDNDLAGQMATLAAELLGTLTGGQRAAAAYAFADDAARRWLEYRPERRPGLCLAEISPAARKAAHRLLSSGLSEHAFAQAMAITSLEEVLDRRELGARGRHSGDYWVAVFGDPAAAAPWSWRFEGHHLSVTMTIAGGAVSPAPLFLGANPARVTYAGRLVSRPLGPEEDLALALLDTLGPAARAAAVVADRAPEDIHSARDARAGRIEPAGVAASGLGPAARAALSQLVAAYLDRLPPGLAATEADRAAAGELHFAWAGPAAPGTRHYYRVQGDDLLIEYDHTEPDGNHAHTVLRRPRSDFGADVLAAHRRDAHQLS
ncbi:MAG TPA: DUF3500 domain-containing protein [Streptosporangiaceae bacterium]|nr:DUF3500 domain-containing protein [Streptosporangiaceae bacterium]